MPVTVPATSLPFALALSLALLPASGAVVSGEGTGESVHGPFEAAFFLESEDHVSDVAFAPDGTLYYAELNTGNVRAVPPGGPGPGAVVATVDTESGGNGGFLGIAIDPEFAETRAIFAYYTTREGSGKFNRVSRLTAEGETVLVDRIPWGQLHDGGKLAFLPDKTLLVTTGDNDQQSPAQDPDDLRGKILRINRDGSIPEDNPASGSPVYAMGVRNAFGLAVDPETGRAWFSDNGPDREDEVNAIEAGGNYGWPDCLGKCGNGAYIDPVVSWAQVFGPTGLAYFEGDLYLGDFVNGHVRRIDLGADPAGWEVLHTFPGERVLSVAVGADGRSLYVGTYGEIYRITFTDLPDRSPPPGDEGGDAGNGGSFDGDPEEAGAPPSTPGPGLLLLAAGALLAAAARGVPRKR